MSQPVVFGAAYSVYVRAVRLTLAEKGVAYRLNEVDVFAPGGPPLEHLARQPFGRIPAFEHDGFALYEAGAIMRYADEAFTGPTLQPRDVRRRARMNQIMSVLDSYAYWTLVREIFVERVRAPAQNRTPDEARIAAALPKAKVCLMALEMLMNGAPWFTGDELSLADLLAAPMFAYFIMAREGRELISQHGELQDWWARISGRESMAQTRLS